MNKRHFAWWCAGWGASMAFNAMLWLHGWPVVTLTVLAVWQFWIAKHIDRILPP